MRVCSTDKTATAKGEVGTGVLSWVDSPRLVALLDRKPRSLLVILGGNDYQRNDGEAVIQAMST